MAQTTRSESPTECSCSIPAELGESLVRLQTRTDVLKSDQKVLITELHLRIDEVKRLNEAVEDLRVEREKDRTSLESYDKQLKVSCVFYLRFTPLSLANLPSL